MIFARVGRSSGFPNSDDINDFASFVRTVGEALYLQIDIPEDNTVALLFSLS
jgi:hypothetical protein